MAVGEGTGAVANGVAAGNHQGACGPNAAGGGMLGWCKAQMGLLGGGASALAGGLAVGDHCGAWYRSTAGGSALGVARGEQGSGDKDREVGIWTLDILLSLLQLTLLVHPTPVLQLG